jgi:glutamine amidotransferase
MTSAAPLVTVVDLGVSNVGSVANMCAKIGYRAEITRDPARLVEADRVLLPGVGAFDSAMRRLETDGLADAIRASVDAGKKLLGICLGMQLLFEASDEGNLRGLCLIPGRVRRLSVDSSAGRVRVPHMGWNTIASTKESSLLSHSNGASRFYFVHSYAARPAGSEDVLAYTTHGDPFVSMVERANVAGVQFHPEKSHRHGAALLRSFLEL